MFAREHRACRKESRRCQCNEFGHTAKLNAPAGLVVQNVRATKYNTDGAQQWLATYNSPANSTDTGFEVGLDSEGNVYVSGSRTGPDASLDYVLVKYSQ